MLNFTGTYFINKHVGCTVLLCLFIFYASVGQTKSYRNTNTTVIFGTVKDSITNSALGYVTLVLQKPGKNEPVITTLSREDGYFELAGITEKEYQLTLSYVGYGSKVISLSRSQTSVINLGTILLLPVATQLEEVQVITTIPLVEQDLDKLIYNIEADPEAISLNTLDMFRKIPLLTVDAEDNLLLKGQDNYQILVNGKRTTFFSGNPSEALKALPASSIKKVEVITDPSAKYDASGIGGIINIITHKKSLSGYNGSFNTVAGTPETYSCSASIRATAGKVSFSGRYGSNYNSSPTNKTNFFREDLERLTRLEQTSAGSTSNRSQSLGGELSYELSSQDQFTANYSINQSKGYNDFVQQVEQLSTTGETAEAYQNINNGKHKGNGEDISLDYQKSFQKNSQQLLSFSLNLLNNASNSTSDFMLKPLLNYKGHESNTSNNDDIRELILQADYVQPIGKQTLELGIKSAFEKNSSNYFYMNLDSETGAFLLDSTQSNSYDYHQYINAAYISLNLYKEQWSLRSGARLEEANLSASFRSTGTIAKQEYLNLFPTITLSRKLRESGTANLSYSQRIQRPGLYYLNPYIDQTDPLNISYGNPDLEAATSHIIQFEYNTYIKNSSFSIGLFHTFTNNSIEQFTVLGEDSVARTTYGNLGQNHNYSLSFSGNTNLWKKLRLSLNSRAQYVKYSSLKDDGPQNKGFSYTVQGTGNYRFGKGWRINGAGSFNSANVMLQGKTGGYASSSLSLTKDFLKNNNASVSLSVRNPFQRYRRSTNEVKGLTFYQFRESYTVTRQFNFALIYRFGKLQ